jgi:hypothetical protein
MASKWLRGTAAFMKLFWVIVGTVIGLPAILWTMLKWLGFNSPNLDITQIPIWVGSLIFLIIVMVAGIIATTRGIYQVEQKAAQDFYAINPGARIDRAHHIFYELYESARDNYQSWRGILKRCGKMREAV